MMNPAKPGKMKPGIQDENTPWTFLNELTELCVRLVFNSISSLLIRVINGEGTINFKYCVLSGEGGAGGN